MKKNLFFHGFIRATWAEKNHAKIFQKNIKWAIKKK